MPFTVNEFSDLLRIIEAQPEWRAKLRRALFPEIDVPKALQELAEAQRRTEAAIDRLTMRLETGFAEAAAERKAMKQDTQELTTRVETGFAEAAAERKAMKQDTQELTTRVEAGFAEAAAERKAMTTRVEAGFAEAAAERKDLTTRLEAGFAETAAGFAEAAAERKTLRQDVSNIRQDVGRLKGLSHEQFFQLKANAIFGRYLKRGRDATEWVADQLQEAQKSGKVSEDAYDQVMAADLLWGGQLRTTGDEIILVIEASWFAEQNDVERAVARAAVLRDLGLKALPVIAGREWADDLPELAREQGVVLTGNGRVNKASWQAALSN